jgi:peptide/nickel transport system substrate-binding protein
MPVTLRARSARLLAVVGLVAALLVPAAAPAVAQEELVLRVATTQPLDSMNPFNTALVVGFEVFTLNYDLLVNFGPDLEPVPGFAESWEQSADKLSWTFKIPEGLLWSDGTPATAEDARWTIQLVLDALASEDASLCLGYIDPYVANSGTTAVSAPDATTLVVTTSHPDEKILQWYLPILPKHVWGSQTLQTICDFTNDPPVVGTGPYQAVEWTPEVSVVFDRNPHFSRQQGAADRVVIQDFADSGTMAEALRNGEIDYAAGLNAEQFEALQGQPDIVTVEGPGNGFTELGFNTYGTGTGNTIPDGGPSTPALLDPVFRDALGYAIDKEELVDRVLGGYGDVGTTQVPPFQAVYHVEPETPRTFSIETAAQKLLDAGYELDAQGQRLDKEGNPISLSLVLPDDEIYIPSAQFIEDWFGQLGIQVSSQTYEDGPLVDLMLPPEAGAEYKADYDLFIWGWGGDPDPNSLLEIFTCGQIGDSSDSLYCNPAYDQMFEDQNLAPDIESRQGIVAEMQQIIYDEAPYHVLFYDSNTVAYRTDTFGGWQNQPRDGGVPLYAYGSLDYTLLTEAAATPSASPGASPGASAAASPGASAAASPGASAAPSASPGGGQAGTGDTGINPALLGAVLVGALAVVVGGLVMVSRRRAASAGADDDDE